jgi:hypothetical protein
MRNITVVIDKIVKEIPPEHIEIVDALESLKRSCGYSAPEMITERWYEFCSILSGYIPNPEKQWELNVKDIFNGKS